MQPAKPMIYFLPCEEDNDQTLTAIELHGKYDRLFKEIVSSGWTNESNGSTEAPSGYFTKIEVGSDRAAMRDMLDGHDSYQFQNTDLFDELNDGWYLTKEDDNGLIWVWFDSKDNIDSAFAYLESEFRAWADAEDDL
jgi:hypothetical protein